MQKSLPAMLEGAPVFWAACLFVAGMVTAHIAGPRAGLLPVCGVWLLVAVVFNLLYPFGRSLRNRRLSFCSCCLMLMALGAVLMALSERAAPAVWPDQVLTWRGFVVDSRDGGTTVRCRVRLCSRAEGRRWVSDDANVEVTLLKDSLVTDSVLPGEALLFRGRMTGPVPSGNPDAFDYAGWLRRQGVAGTCAAYHDWALYDKTEAERLLAMQPLHVRWLVRLQHLRTRWVTMYEGFPLSAEDRSVLSALTLGSRYGLSQPVRRLYATVGGSHVLALSGLHLSILVMVLMAVMKPFCRTRRGRMLSRLISIAFIWFFAFLTGASLSLLRAAVMYTMLTLFILQGRVSNGLNSLAVAAFVLLLISPQSLFDIGFQLSFLSVLSIMVLYPLYRPHRPGALWAAVLCDFVFMAVAAQLATAPLVAYAFNVLPTYFLLTGFVVIPCAYALTGGAAVFFLLHFIAPLRWLAMWTMTFTVGIMNSGLKAIASLPSASLTVYPSALLTLSVYVFIVVLLVCLVHRGPKSLAATMVAAAMCVGVLLADRGPGRVEPQLIFFNSYSCPAVQFVAAADRSYVWSPSGDSLKVETALTAAASRFWGRRRVEPRRHFAESFDGTELKGTENIFRFRGLTVAMLTDNRWSRRRTARPMPVDYLYVCPGFGGRLDRTGFRPKVVVLSSSLRERRRAELRSECLAMGRSCYDVAELGALQVETDGQ